jgi:hypothetical protein
MKKFILSLCLLILAPGVYGHPDVPIPEKNEKPVEIARDRNHRVVMIKKNRERFTKNWAFVVDSSHSTWAIAGKILTGFNTATGFPTDQLRFCTYVFNDPGWTSKHYRDWVDACPEEFTKTQKWIRQTRGVGSIAGPAIIRAFQQPVEELTVLIISDGGFTDGGGRGGQGISVVKGVIEKGQQWRVAHGLERAVVVSIGIENSLCWPQYPKLPNSDCQIGMRALGVEGKGGFFYIHRLRPHVRRTAQALKASSD